MFKWGAGLDLVRIWNDFLTQNAREDERNSLIWERCDFVALLFENVPSDIKVLKTFEIDFLTVRKF